MEGVIITMQAPKKGIKPTGHVKKAKRRCFTNLHATTLARQISVTVMKGQFLLPCIDLSYLSNYRVWRIIDRIKTINCEIEVVEIRLKMAFEPVDVLGEMAKIKNALILKRCYLARFYEEIRDIQTSLEYPDYYQMMPRTTLDPTTIR